MSDTNYEFIIFDRPIILLANDWLRENFPDIGIKTDIEGLEQAIKKSIEQPQEYQKQRLEWLEKTVHKPDGHSSKRVLETILEKAQLKEPHFVVQHRDDAVHKTNLAPLAREIKKQGFQ